MNELTTNACKYAFADHANPQLRISVGQQKQELTLTVTDNGPGHDWPGHNWHRTAPSPRSFGLRLIQMQVAQLNGNYSFERNDGTRFSMQFAI